MNPASEPQAKRKFLKIEVHFEHPAKKANYCMDCVHYYSNSQSCEIVRGLILPHDWCDQFKRGRSE